MRPPEIPLHDLARRLELPLVGDGSVRITGISPIESASSGRITFSKERRPSALDATLERTKASAAIVDASFLERFLEHSPPLPLLFAKSPLEAIVELTSLFHHKPPPSGAVSDKAEVHPSARLGERVTIGPFSVVGAECVLEDDVEIHPHVVLYPRVKVGAGSVLHAGVVVREDTVIGRGTTIQPGAVLGADGFGYLTKKGEGLVPVPQIGHVEIGDKVDIGANSCVDRATFGATIIGVGSKIDNQVQIGHNVSVGSFSIICGQVGIAGSAVVGNGVVIGGQAGLKDHVVVADGVRIGAKSGVISDLEKKGDYAGFPATPAPVFRRQLWALSKLPELLKRLGGDEEEPGR